MSAMTYPDVLVYLLETDVNMRRNLRYVLDHYGFGRVEVFPTVDKLQRALYEESPDLIVCDSSVNSAAMTRLIRQLRHWQKGDNPFVPIIATTWDATEGNIHAIIASGTDQLLGKPLTARDLIKRIDAVIQKRRPFIVTPDYIGPDRKSKSKRLWSPNPEARLIDVPNVLQNKVEGDGSGAMDLERQIYSAWREINDERVGNNAYQVSFLFNLIKENLGRPGHEDLVEKNSAALVQTCRDSVRRLRGGRFEHVGELFQRLYTSALHVYHNPHNPDHRQFRLMEQLVKALLLAVTPNQDELDIARNISSTVSSFQQTH